MVTMARPWLGAFLPAIGAKGKNKKKVQPSVLLPTAQLPRLRSDVK